ncbi:MAG: hypothetical protein A4E63_00006 [Syntrophorhabdus sp. PtaU1.Bin050]|jgi:hypothetical protein|nr:MAG: hypothetical protein A4E63_00006 [Syntrophorhabdus sp. PtaU1.Bin050]
MILRIPHAPHPDEAIHLSLGFSHPAHAGCEKADRFW